MKSKTKEQLAKEIESLRRALFSARCYVENYGTEDDGRLTSEASKTLEKINEVLSQ